MMPIDGSPFPGVSLVGAVLMCPVVPCGPGHKMQLFPIDSIISALEILLLPAQPAGTDCLLYIPLSRSASQCWHGTTLITLRAEHAETQGTAGCHTLPACTSLGADRAQGNSRTKADKALQLS